MKRQARFITSIQEAAAKEQTQLPWTRGARRTAFIVKRMAPPRRKSA